MAATTSATVLVLLPGMDGTGDLFGPLLAALDGRCGTRIVRYPEQRPLDYAQLLPFVRSALPVGARYMLVAESFSGPLAITLASERPDGLCGLVLCGSFARNPRPALARAAGLLGMTPMHGALLRVAASTMLGRGVDHAVHKLVRRAVARIPPSVLRTRLREVLRVDVTRELESIEVPILYLQATHDLAVPPSAAKVIRHHRPDVRLARIGGPHFLLQANPEDSAAEIVRFVTASTS